MKKMDLIIRRCYGYINTIYGLLKDWAKMR